MSLSDDDATQVPLVERLRHVPVPAKINMEWGTGHFPAMTSHPVGRLCHDAADELDRLTTELAAAKKDAERLHRVLLSVLNDAYDDLDSELQKKIFELYVPAEPTATNK